MTPAAVRNLIFAALILLSTSPALACLKGDECDTGCCRGTVCQPSSVCEEGAAPLRAQSAPEPVLPWMTYLLLGLYGAYRLLNAYVGRRAAPPPGSLLRVLGTFSGVTWRDAPGSVKLPLETMPEALPDVPRPPAAHTVSRHVGLLALALLGAVACHVAQIKRVTTAEENATDLIDDFDTWAAEHEHALNVAIKYRGPARSALRDFRTHKHATAEPAIERGHACLDAVDAVAPRADLVAQTCVDDLRKALDAFKKQEQGLVPRPDAPQDMAAPRAEGGV